MRVDDRAPATRPPAGLTAGVLLLAACAGTPSEIEAPLRRFDVQHALMVYERRAPEPAALERIAAAVLEAEALSGDAARSRAAMAALARSGTHALPALRRLARNRFDEGVRAEALGMLARMHDSEAISLLEQVEPQAGAEWQAAAALALSPQADHERLLQLAQAPAAESRLAALQRLTAAPRSDELRLLAARVARHDPDPAVRRVALRLLGRQGSAAVANLLERLADAPVALRGDVLAALASVDYAAAVRAADPWIASDPSPTAIDVARVLVQAGGQAAPAKALDLLARALRHRDDRVRARAAVALSALPADDRAELARSRLGQETERSIQLLLALALPDSDANARRWLRRLMRNEDVVAAQAAVELARRVRPRSAAAPQARARALELAGSEHAPVRASTVGPLARELGAAHEVRRALLDPDARVRVAAAWGILAG